MNLTNEPLKQFQGIIEVQKKLKTYSGISAKINKLLNNTIKIKNHNILIDKKDLTKNIIKIITDDEKIASNLKTSKKIQSKVAFLVEKYDQDPSAGDVILNLLLNIKQQHLQLEKAGYTASSKVDILRILDEVDPDIIPSMKWPENNDLTEINKKLKPGDIIFMQNRGNLDGAIDISIVKGQKISKRWMKGELEPEVETYTHVAIYLGKGMIAEATPGHEGHDVRILPFNHKKVALKPGNDYEYRICRAKDKKIGEAAANLAKRHAELKVKDQEDDIGGKTKLQYGYKKALLSLGPDRKNFDKKAKQKLITESYLAAESISEKNAKGKDPDFFCSYFVAHCLQVGNAGVVTKDLIDNYGLTPPKLDGKSEKEKIKIINKWAKEELKKNPKMLDDVKISYNSKNLSPQKFRSVVSNNPEQFEDVFRIIPAFKKAQTII